jgi:RNA polymerase sigma-70 factor (ECF subfamily)
VADQGFAAFYAGSYRRLLGQLFAVTGDLAEAENVLQEAYARAFVRWSRVGAYDLPEAWVRRVAINVAAMADRSLAQRQVIVLHHLVGLPVEEVASELRLATGTVKSRLARGRAALASTLQLDWSEVT